MPVLLDALPPLAERYYSVASSPLEHPTTLRIAFTLVSFSTVGADGRRHRREGLCSSHLARLGEDFIASGGWVKPRVRLYRRRPTGNELRLPRSLASPVIMVGPGTGVAPFMAFLQERRALRKQSPDAQVGEARLFFGCQHRVGDFLFDRELQAMEQEGTLTELHTAFSRDAADSAAAGEWRSVRINVNYVQDLFHRSASKIVDLVQKHGAHIYVCGDGRSMAADVHKELVAIFAAELRAGPEEAAGLLARLAEEGRYAREIWFG